jgi:4-diphosphocytidyl-2-C-methyl-D-erythritol kinase
MNLNGAGTSIDVVAPAKLNLSLLVGPVRPDGYHEIASLMIPVTLGDRVKVEHTPGQGLEVVCDVAPGQENLAARLVHELSGRLDRAFDVRITIAKHIPVGAGLAGGSSDAAATLVALERLFDLDLSTRERYALAAAVGSDVPFFLYPGAQMAMGRGQVLKPMALPAMDLVIVVPDFALSTAEVYAWRDEDSTVDIAGFSPRARHLSAAAQSATGLSQVAALVHNDLEESVVSRRPQVGEVRDQLLVRGAIAAAMTGSGSAVFGLFVNAAAANEARRDLPFRSWHVTDLQPLSAS